MFNKKEPFNNKKEYGQFMTTNYQYILQNMNIPKNINKIIEPFCGQGDLLKFIKKDSYQVECYDIEPKRPNIIKRDTIKNPPSYIDAFLLTNPPYLARNKTKNKELFDKYSVNDLYKCVIKEILTNTPLGGILIIPLNFWCSIRISDIKLRQLFLKVFNVMQLNIFEETVFTDTSYTICAFQFIKKTGPSKGIPVNIYPSNKLLTIELGKENAFTIGGEIYLLKPVKKYKINRITSKNKTNKAMHFTNILVKCIDDNKNNQISLSIVDDKDIYIDNTPRQTARTYASLLIEPSIDKTKQKILVESFNSYLTTHRNTYHSLFLTNYRESKDIARKRISFDLVYRIVGYLLGQIDESHQD